MGSAGVHYPLSTQGLVMSGTDPDSMCSLVCVSEYETGVTNLKDEKTET